MIDTHAHVYWKSFDADRALVLDRARAAGVQRMIVVGTDLATSEAARELARAHDGLHWTAGLHPHDASTFDAGVEAVLARACAATDCVAVGETGLDHFKEYSPRAVQRESFARQIELARALDKPVVVHCRDAHAETVDLLRAAPGVRGVMHCYTMGVEELAPYLELGFYISFSGVVTYAKNDANRRAARAVPIDRLLIETDSPFLAPQSRRGSRNEPAFVSEVLEVLASTRSEDREMLDEATSGNAMRLFGLPRN